MRPIGPTTTASAHATAHSHAAAPALQAHAWQRPRCAMRSRLACHATTASPSGASGPLEAEDPLEAAAKASAQRQALKGKLRQEISKLSASPDSASRRALMDTVSALCALTPVGPFAHGQRRTLEPRRQRQPRGAFLLLLGAGGLASALPFLQTISDSIYRIFYRYVPVLAGSAVGKQASLGPLKAHGNFQTFDTAKAVVLNQARFSAFGSNCEILVGGSVEVVPPASAGAPVTRFRATFVEGELGIGDGIARTSIPIPLGWLSPVGYVDTPYLDDELRISRGDKGSLFVAARVPPE